MALKKFVVIDGVGQSVDMTPEEETQFEAERAPPTAAQVDARKTSQANDVVNLVQFLMLFNHENRIRALQGQAALTPAQFRDIIKTFLD